MKDVVRYEKAIYAKLRFLQAKIEMKRAAQELEKHLTVAESKSKHNLNWEACKDVMHNLSNRYDIKLVPKDYVHSSIKYKNVEMYLHDTKPYGFSAVKHILEE